MDGEAQGEGAGKAGRLVMANGKPAALAEALERIEAAGHAAVRRIIAEVFSGER